MKMNPFKMNLQFFAEDEGSAGGASDDGGKPDGGVTFSDEQQAKINEILQDHLGKAQVKFEQSTKEQVAAAIENYKKQSGMTDEQRKQEEDDATAKRIAELEGQIEQRKLIDHAKAKAVEKSVPESLADWAVGASDEETDARLEALSKEFNKRVQAEVEERLKGKTTPGAGGGSAGGKEGSYGERLAKANQTPKPKTSYFN